MSLPRVRHFLSADVESLLAGAVDGAEARLLVGFGCCVVEFVSHLHDSKFTVATGWGNFLLAGGTVLVQGGDFRCGEAESAHFRSRTREPRPLPPSFEGNATRRLTVQIKRYLQWLVTPFTRTLQMRALLAFCSET
jgi:hypothetical protein